MHKLEDRFIIINSGDNDLLALTVIAAVEKSSHRCQCN